LSIAGIGRALRGRAPAIAFCGGLAVLFLAPIGPIVYQAFIDKPLYDRSATLTLGNFARLFADPDFTGALVNTAWFAVPATLLSVLLGGAFSLLIERVDLPFRKTLRVLFLSPLFISPLIMAFAWSMLYGPGGYVAAFLRVTFGFGLPNLNSMGGMILIAGVVQSPISYLFFAAAAANIPDSFERSARCSGAGPWMTLWSIVLPLLRPAIMYCVLLNFMLVVDLLAVPLIIGEPARVLVLSTFLYTKGAISARMDYGLIAAAGVLMIAIVQLFIWAQARWVGDSRRYVTVGGKGGQRTLADLGAAGYLVSFGILVFVALASIVPTVFLVLRSFTGVLTPLIPIADVLTLENYGAILQYEQYVRSIGNSLLIATLGGIAAVALTFLACVFAYRTSPAARTAIEQLSFVPRAVPGVVVGLGFFYGMILMPGGEFLRNGLIILVVAFSIRHFPTGFGALSPAFRQVGEELDRAARVSGAGRWTALRDITLPLTKSALVACFMLYFINFLKEYSSAAFLFGPGSEVIGTTMLQLNFSGYLGTLAALAVIELVIIVPAALLVYRGK
jgi:iron(III) transport system permease protein